MEGVPSYAAFITGITCADPALFHVSSSNTFFGGKFLSTTTDSGATAHKERRSRGRVLSLFLTSVTYLWVYPPKSSASGMGQLENSTKMSLLIPPHPPIIPSRPSQTCSSLGSATGPTLCSARSCRGHRMPAARPHPVGCSQKVLRSVTPAPTTHKSPTAQVKLSPRFCAPGRRDPPAGKTAARLSPQLLSQNKATLSRPMRQRANSPL